MKVALGQIVQDLKRQSVKRRMSFTVILVLSLFVSTGIVWKLRSVGITMVNDAECGIEEHVHDESCYLHELICGIDDTSDSDDTIGSDDENAENIHVHDINCFTEEFICDKEEHSHNLECFGDESLVEKLKNKNEIQVVEIPDAYVVENIDGSEEDETENKDEDADYDESEDSASEDNENEEMVTEDEEDELSEDEYDDILSQLGNRVSGHNLMNEMAIVNPSKIQNGVIYKFNNNDSEHNNCVHEESDVITVFKGENFQLCVHGYNISDNFYGNGNNYSYGDAITGTTRNKGTSEKEKIGDFTAKTKGTAEVFYYYPFSNGKDNISQKIEVKDETDLNKIFLVMDDGSEVVVNEPLVIKKGEAKTFCIYTDNTDANTHVFYKVEKNGETYYGNYSNIISSSEQSRQISENIRRLQVTYTAKEAINYEVGFNYSSGNYAWLNVNVSSGYENFDYENLYKIFWVKDDGSEVSDIPSIKKGDTLTFSIYTDYTNTVNPDNKQNHTLYQNNSSSISADWNSRDEDTFTDTRDGLPEDSIIRRYQISFTFKDIGDYEILYNAVTPHKVRVINNENTILLKQDNTYLNVTNGEPYSANNPLELEIGDSIDLIAYQMSDSYDADHDFFYNEDNQKTNVDWKNRVEMFNGTRVVRAHVTAIAEGTHQYRFNYNNKGRVVMYIKVVKHIENKIYIETNLGPRNKDKVHERGSAYEPNSEGEEKNRYENRYILYMDSTKNFREQIPICIFTDKEGEFVCENDVVSITGKQAGTDSSGARKVSAMITANTAGITKVYFKDNSGNIIDDFYICVREDDGRYENMDHADIEIADGGYYEVERKVFSDNNTKMTVYYERYDTYITKVNSCDIKGVNDAKLFTFDDTMYKQTGNPGEQQYELNSKQKMNGKTCYNRYDVRSAVFDVNITMILAEERVTVYDVKDGNAVESSKNEIKNNKYNDNSIKKEMENIIFYFDMQGIIDAFNKCSNHSGLDFNVTNRLNEIMTQISFPSEKLFVDEQGNKLSGISKQFNFLLSENSGLVETKQNNISDGKISFSDKYIQIDPQYQIKSVANSDDTVKTFHYTIKENLSGISNNFISYDNEDYGISVDTSVYEIYVKTFLNTDTKLMETRYYKDSAYTEEFKDMIVFKNKVLNKYTGISVKKIWSDDGGYHRPESITFEIVRTNENNVDETVRIGNSNSTEIVLNNSNSWTYQAANLPLIYDNGKKYRYSVREKEVPANYSVSYPPPTVKDNVISCNIVNTYKDYFSLSVKKQWLTPEGTELQNPPLSEISATVKRKLKDRTMTVPVSVIHGQTNAQIASRSFTTSGDKGFKFSLSQYDEFMTVDARNCVCTHDYNTGVFQVTNIKPGASVKLIYDIIYYSFEDASYKDDWYSRGDSNVKLGEAWSTYYSSHNTDGFHAIDCLNRSVEWHGIGLKFKLKKQQTYSMKAYVTYNDTVNNYYRVPKADGGYEYYQASQEKPANIQTYYNQQFYWGLAYSDYDSNKNNSSDGINYNYFVDQKTVGSAKQWTELSNLYFQVPDGKGEYYFYFKSLESYANNNNDHPYLDFYIDEVSIAPAGVNVITDPSTGTVSYTLPSPSITINDNGVVNNSCHNGTIDDSWTKDITLKSSENWIVTLSRSDVADESPSHEYSYYVEEKTQISGFTLSYQDDNVSANTPETPIIIQNHAIAYQLPPTGGSGTIKYTASGMTLIFAASAGIFYRRRRKRKSSA